jgi:acetolactate synthase-1/2/3 large subunit
MTGRPALTLVHLGPSFANGIANLHNARRAQSPVVNLIGDTPPGLAADAPLTTDVDSLASPVSAWVRHSTSASRCPPTWSTPSSANRRRPGRHARRPPGPLLGRRQRRDGRPPAWPSPATVTDSAVLDAANAVRSARRVVLVIGGNALGADGKRAAVRLRDGLGVTVYTAAPNGRQARGRHLPTIAALPYFPEAARRAIGDADLVVLAGAKDPVTFFGYPDQPSRVVSPDVMVVALARPTDDAAAARRPGRRVEGDGPPPSGPRSGRGGGGRRSEPGRHGPDARLRVAGRCGDRERVDHVGWSVRVLRRARPATTC